MIAISRFYELRHQLLFDAVLFSRGPCNRMRRNYELSCWVHECRRATLFATWEMKKRLQYRHAWIRNHINHNLTFLCHSLSTYRILTSSQLWLENASKKVSYLTLCPIIILKEFQKWPHILALWGVQRYILTWKKLFYEQMEWM